MYLMLSGSGMGIFSLATEEAYCSVEFCVLL